MNRDVVSEAILDEALDLDTTTRKVGVKNKTLGLLCDSLKKNSKEFAETIYSYKRRNDAFETHLNSREAPSQLLLVRLSEQTERLADANDRLEALHAERPNPNGNLAKLMRHTERLTATAVNAVRELTET